MKVRDHTQLRQLVESLNRLEGLSAPAIASNPGVERLGTLIRSGFSLEDERRDLRLRLDHHREAWGDAASSTLGAEALAKHPLLEGTKIYALATAGIDPTKVKVTEHVVAARGTVDGEPIGDRDVFVQRFEPEKKSGEVIVVSPGFMETGRNFYEQIAMMLARGHEVVVMDHQWAGYTTGGEPGGLDRLYGAARDVASVLADVEQRSPGSKVTVFGNSMGGAAALAAVVLTEQNRIQLEGQPKPPKSPKLVLQAPFLELNDWWLNDALAFVAKQPILRPLANASMPAMGAPVIVDPTDPANMKKTSEWAVLNDAHGKLQSLVRANDDLADLEKQLSKVDLSERVAIVIGNKDRLASVSGAQRFADKLHVPSDRFRIIESANHVMEQSPRDQKHAIELMDTLLAGKADSH